MDHKQERAKELQLKFHGQIATIDSNEMNDTFWNGLELIGIDYAKYEEDYTVVSDYYSRNYENIKEKSDNLFVKEVIDDMLELSKIASDIRGLEEK